MCCSTKTRLFSLLSLITLQCSLKFHVAHPYTSPLHFVKLHILETICQVAPFVEIWTSLKHSFYQRCGAAPASRPNPGKAPKEAVPNFVAAQAKKTGTRRRRDRIWMPEHRETMRAATAAIFEEVTTGRASYKIFLRGHTSCACIAASHGCSLRTWIEDFVAENPADKERLECARFFPAKVWRRWHHLPSWSEPGTRVAMISAILH